jgi:hypothetical protein
MLHAASSHFEALCAALSCFKLLRATSSCFEPLLAPLSRFELLQAAMSRFEPLLHFILLGSIDGHKFLFSHL